MRKNSIKKHDHTPMKEIENLRKNIKVERQKQKLSRVKLARKSGVSPFTIIDVELGRSSNDMKLSTLIKIAKGLEVPISRLLK